MRAKWRLRDIIYTLVQLVPIGKVTTYSVIAAIAGTSPRAVARILAANPTPIVVPCHRVVKADGSLGGYSLGGPKLKRALLELEGVVFDDKGRVISRCMIRDPEQLLS